jgi:hypothetical protein
MAHPLYSVQLFSWPFFWIIPAFLVISKYNLSGSLSRDACLATGKADEVRGGPFAQITPLQCRQLKARTDTQ